MFPIFVKQFFSKVKIIMSVQGYPKFLLIKRTFVKQEEDFYTKAYKIFTMSNAALGNEISEEIKLL